MSIEQRVLKLWRSGLSIAEVAGIVNRTQAEVWALVKVQTAGQI